MYVTEVAPIAKIPLPSSQVLTYFTSQKLAEGSLVLVPLRKKEVVAIVLSQKKVDAIKMEVKRAGFKLRPVSKIIEKSTMLLPYQLELARWISNYYWAPLGKNLSLFLPTFFMKGLIKGKVKEKILFGAKTHINKTTKKSISKLYIAPLGFLPKEEIQTVLDQKKQILFLIPEKNRSDFWTRKIKKAIDSGKQKNHNLCFFSTNLPLRKFLESFKKIKEGKNRIIIGTRSALFAPFTSLGLIVVLEETSKNYKSEMEPRYNAKDVAGKLANILGINLILISPLPLIEDYVKFKKIVGEETKFQEIEKEIIDMRSVSRISQDNILKEWSSLSPFLLNEIKKYLSLKKKVLLFINRKGEGLSVVCQDCGWIKKCQNCEVPLILRREKGEKILTMTCCHCGFKNSPPKQCGECRSWRLISLGSGIERVERELKEIFKNSKILRLDSEIAPRRSTQNKILKEFLKKDSDILITTSLLFRYSPLLLGNKIPLVGVVSIDSLLSLPNFRSEEESVRIIYDLFCLTQDKFILQTFWLNSQLVNFIKNGYNFFLKEAVKEREEFSHPPFSSLIKLTFSHRNPKTARGEAYNLKRMLEKEVMTHDLKVATQILGPAPSFIPKIKGKYIWKILIKIKDGKEVNFQIKIKNQVLNIVPARWKIDVDPVRILI